jgi:hypothetical protein
LKRINNNKRRDFEDEMSLEESLLGEEIQQDPSTAHTVDSDDLHSAPKQRSSKKQHFFSDGTDEDQGKYPIKSALPRRHHSTSSIASGCDTLSEASDINTHMYSRTATAMTKSTQNETLDSASLREGSPCERYSDADFDDSGSLAAADRRYRSSSDRYVSAASKGKKLLEEVRKGSTGSPRHGRIIVRNSSYSDHPILSQDSHDNVEVEYMGQQFGMI